MAGNCARSIDPSSSNPKSISNAKAGDVLVFNINPPIVYPCHEKVEVVSGAELQQESGNSFQVKLTADRALVNVTIWCNALLPNSDAEGAMVCKQIYPFVLGKAKPGYIDCFKHCISDIAAFLGLGTIYFALLGIFIGALFGGVVGAVIGGYGGALIPIVTGGAYCSIKCFFETL